MKQLLKKTIGIILSATLLTGMAFSLSGCNDQPENPQPSQTVTAEAENGGKLITYLNCKYLKGCTIIPMNKKRKEIKSNEDEVEMYICCGLCLGDSFIVPYRC